MTYSWNFGDGATATGSIVQHTFISVGTYSATVTVSNAQSSTTSDPMTINVTPMPEPRNSASLFYVSPSVNPGRTILFQGGSLAASSQATIVRMNDVKNPDPSQATFNFPVVSDPSSGTTVPVLQAANASAKITVASSLSPGIYAVQFQPPPGSASQTAATAIHAMVNVPEIQWWMGRSTVPGSTGLYAYAGQEFDIFGRNFGNSPAVWVSLNGIFTAVPVLQSNPYRVRLTLPANITPGSYTIWVHNGYGGQYGFAVPVALTVAAPTAAWPTTQFNVMQYGATGNGTTDDTAAIKAALNAAGASTQNGGTVYLPAGKYLVSGKLSIPPNTIFIGAGTKATTLVTASISKSTGAYPALLAGNAHFVVRDLTIVSNAVDYLVTCPDVPGMYHLWGIDQPLGAACHDVTLENVNITHTTLEPTLPNGGNNWARTLNFQGSDVRIMDSTIATQNGKTLFLNNNTNSVITHNVFLDGRNSYMSMTDSQQSIIENNDISANDPSGNCVDSQDRITFLYVANNYIHDCQGTYGQAFSTDTPYFPFRLSHPTSIDATDGTLTYSVPLIDPNVNVPTGSKMDLSAGYVAVVVGGTGVGQLKTITGNTYTQVTVDSPWQVPLDSTSVIDLQMDKSRNVFYQNKFLNSSVGIQLYSQAYANVVDGSTGTNTGGTYCVGIDAPAQVPTTKLYLRRFEYCYYNEWLNNALTSNLPDSNPNRDQESAYPNAFVGEVATVGSFAGAANAATPTDPLIMFIGNSVRDNNLQNNYTLGFAYGSVHPTIQPSTRDTVFSLDFLVEGNVIQHCQPAGGTSRSSPFAIDIFPGAFNSLIDDTHVSDCPTPEMNASQTLPSL